MYKNGLHEMTPQEFYEDHICIWRLLAIAFLVCIAVIIITIYYVFK